MKEWTRKNGFTLVEIMLVAMLLIIFIAVSVVVVTNFTRMKKTSETIYSDDQGVRIIEKHLRQKISASSYMMVTDAAYGEAGNVLELYDLQNHLLGRYTAGPDTIWYVDADNSKLNRTFENTGSVTFKEETVLPGEKTNQVVVSLERSGHDYLSFNESSGLDFSDTWAIEITAPNGYFGKSIEAIQTFDRSGASGVPTGFLLMGRYYRYPAVPPDEPGFYFPLVFSIDDNGQIQWCKRYYDDENKISLCTSSLIQTFQNINGGLSTGFVMGSYGHGSNDPFEKECGHIISRMSFVKIEDDGDPEYVSSFRASYGYGMPGYGMDVVYGSDGSFDGFILSGDSWIFGAPPHSAGTSGSIVYQALGNTGAILIKTNSDGEWKTVQESGSGYSLVGKACSYAARCDEGAMDNWPEYNKNGIRLYDVQRAYDYTSAPPVNDGFIACGFTDMLGSIGHDMFILKVDNNLDVEWARTIGLDDNPAFLGSYSMDATMYPSNGEKAFALDQTSDNGFIFTGTSSEEGVYIVKLDNGGDHVWSRAFGTSSFSAASDVIETSDGDIVLVGNTCHPDTTINSETYGFIIKLGSDGTHKWTRVYRVGVKCTSFNSIRERLDADRNPIGYLISGMAFKYLPPDWEWDYTEMHFLLAVTDLNGYCPSLVSPKEVDYFAESDLSMSDIHVDINSGGKVYTPANQHYILGNDYFPSDSCYVNGELYKGTVQLPSGGVLTDAAKYIVDDLTGFIDPDPLVGGSGDPTMEGRIQAKAVWKDSAESYDPQGCFLSDATNFSLNLLYWEDTVASCPDSVGGHKIFVYLPVTTYPANEPDDWQFHEYLNPANTNFPPFYSENAFWDNHTMPYKRYDITPDAHDSGTYFHFTYDTNGCLDLDEHLDNEFLPADTVNIDGRPLADRTELIKFK